MEYLTNLRVAVALTATIFFFPANAQKPSAAVEMIEYLLRTVKGPKPVESAELRESGAILNESRSLKGDVRFLELEGKGHLFYPTGSFGKFTTVADTQLSDATPGIVQRIQKLEPPLSADATTEIVKTELLKHAKTEPAVKFEILTGKLTIASSIDTRWARLGVGDVKVYNVTALVGGVIAACYELRGGKSASGDSLTTIIQDCVHNAMLELKAAIVKSFFEQLSAQQAQAFYEEQREVDEGRLPKE